MFKIWAGVLVLVLAIFMAWRLVEMDYFLLLIVPAVLLDLGFRIIEDGVYG